MAAGASSAPAPALAPASAPVAARLLDGYLAHLATERRLSPLTIENYARDLRALFAATEGTALAGLQVHHLRRAIAQLHAKGLDGRSLARMLSAWRGFFHWLARDHGYTHNPCAGLRAPKTKKALPQVLSPDEATRLMNLPGENALAARDRAIVELFYSSGLRLAELVSLAPDDLNFAEGTVRVTGKGAKTRIVPVGRHAREAIEAWLPQRAQLAKAGETALFVNRAGTRLGARQVQARLKTWALKLGMPQHVHPHMLRHSFASHVLQSSGDLRAVQEMLGHASISTTQVYTHLDFQHLAKVYDAAHPRAKRKN